MEEIVKRGKIEYYNKICSFDIEASSWIEKDGKQIDVEDYNELDQLDKAQCNKVGCMYIWMIDLEDMILYGRNWEEFLSTIEDIRKKLDLSYKKRLIIWVHNLAYEMEFIKTLFNWVEKDCLIIDKYKPCVMVTNNGFEFRCSYLYSGVALSEMGTEELHKLNDSDELDLDYTLLRTPDTMLTQQELNYCFNDVKVLNAYIKRELTLYKNVCDLPHTNTGKVRQYCRNKCLKSPEYKKKIKNLTISLDEYDMLKSAFFGGFTHTNPLHILDTCENVGHIDFISSYPAVMVTRRFPMSKGKKVAVNMLSEKGLDLIFKQKAYLITIRLYNVESKIHYDYYISENWCKKKDGVDTFNGRIVKAKMIELTVNDVDFNMIKCLYRWENCDLISLYTYDKDYLPKQFINSILDLYEKKTVLKDVTGKEIEYALNKSLLNSLYGMCCTDIVKDTVIYDGDYKTVASDKLKTINSYNKSKNRFISYQWGVWTASYARQALFINIANMFKNDYIYSDTDSIFFFESNKSDEYIKKYNDYQLKCIKAASKTIGIPLKRFMPKNQKGKEKVIGIWEREENCKRFKSLGIKRYLEEHEDGSFKMVFSGIKKPRTTGLNYVKAQAKIKNEDVFDTFNEDINFPGYLGLKTVSYRYKNAEGEVTDYLGNKCEYKEASGLSLINVDYKMDGLDKMIEYKSSLTVIHN